MIRNAADRGVNRGSGMALAGDAGHHNDPSTGMGMSDAFIAADLLAEAIHDGLVRHRAMDDALADYRHRRDDLTANGFELTLSTARLAPLSARLEAFYRAAKEQPDAVSPSGYSAARSRSETSTWAARRPGVAVSPPLTENAPSGRSR
jgi:flavin-dependent dehydrogenase